MIPASTPATVPATAEVTYDQWVPVSMSGNRPGPGRFTMSVRLHKCRVLENGDTELHPDASKAVEVVVPDINAPVSAAYPQEARDAVQQAAAAILGAAYAVGAHRQVL